MKYLWFFNALNKNWFSLHYDELNGTQTSLFSSILDISVTQHCNMDFIERSKSVVVDSFTE